MHVPTYIGIYNILYSIICNLKYKRYNINYGIIDGYHYIISNLTKHVQYSAETLMMYKDDVILFVQNV